MPLTRIQDAGSVAEKVLRSATNPLLLIRATEEAKTEGEASSNPSSCR